MSIVSPTLIPREPVVPLVLPKAPHFGPTPLPKRDRFHGRFNTRRDLQREMDDLSDEENDLEDCVCHCLQARPSLDTFSLSLRTFLSGIVGLRGIFLSDAIPHSSKKRTM